MLRIAKSSPGVLDLSAVKDESGLPVVLNGPSHRDVPDHEEDNLVLQRVVAAQWVTLTRLPVGALVDGPTVSNEPVPLQPETSEASEPLQPEALETSETSEAMSVEDNNPPSTTDHVDDVGASPPSDEGGVVDVPTKPEGPTKPFNRSDARRAGRRS